MSSPNLKHLTEEFFEFNIIVTFEKLLRKKLHVETQKICFARKEKRAPGPSVPVLDYNHKQ